MKKINLLATILIVTLFSSFSSAQMYKTGMRLEKSSPKNAEVYEPSSFGFGGVLPDSTSLRPYTPFPGNQGSYGTCVGWAWGYCGLTTLYARQFGITNRNVITAMAMCPYSIFNNIRGESDAGCQYGAGLVEAGEFVTSTGTKRFNLRTSGCGTTDEVDEGLMIYKADSYSILWNWSELEEDEEKDKVNKAKNALADGHIVEIGMGVPPSFSSGVNENGEWIKSKNPYENMPGGGHAMCVVGYNDSRLGGTFEIQNSWGQDWGDGGYVYLSYEDFQEYVVVGLVIELDEESKWTGAASKKGCLFGDCNGAYSRFTFENGDVYEGLIKDGMPEGNGIYQWADGDVYTGEFQGGLKEGVGTYFYADGTTQKGHWKVDEFRADLAYLDYSYGTVEMGNSYWRGYSNGEKWIYGSYYLSYGGKIYEGKFSESNNPDDFGMLDRYGKSSLSEFKNGMHHGFSAVFEDGSWSLFTCEDDDCLDAKEELISKTMEDLPKMAENEADSVIILLESCEFGDCENGYAHYTYSSGNNYHGFLVNGWRHGYGTYTYAEGSEILSYEGEYRFGMRNGVGRLKMKNGGWFIGEFKRGKLDGKGMWVKADGTIQAGFWEKGSYVEEDEGFGFAGGEEITIETNAKEGMTPAKEKTPHKFASPVQLK